ncbi:MAG: ribosome small subunit-dependent GTPase A [Lachnospiraceae bacterium]|nr:ribosome small subunit-dependent GTPase A [Lachnospiraceae bacterium]
MQENSSKDRQGKIIKSLAGFYEVHDGSAVYRCRAKGVFRALGKKPLVGDDVMFDITDTVSVPPEGNVTRLLPRRSFLVRPKVANVDQALLLFAITHPAPSFNMLDRFLISVDRRDLPAILCFNKEDLASQEEKEALLSAYEACGVKVLFISTYESDSLEPLTKLLQGKTTVLTGPSGAGKSSLINRLCGVRRMETGELSLKIARGKNTTRHVELLAAGSDTYLVDTPGFTSLDLTGMEADDLAEYYAEFQPYAGNCRFDGCRHFREPDCAVKAAVESGGISRIRYINYTELYLELKDRKKIYRPKDQQIT